jgi:hypothetical protein
MNLQDAIREVCLYKPFDAPYPVPVHQEQITRKHLSEQEIKATLRTPIAVLDRYLDRIPIHQPAIPEILAALRSFKPRNDIVFVTPKAAAKSPATDFVIGGYSSSHSVESVDGVKCLTIQRSKSRRGQSESFQVNYDFNQNRLDVLDAENALSERDHNRPARFTFRNVIRSILDENDIDQDLREVKELPPPQPDNQ